MKLTTAQVRREFRHLKLHEGPFQYAEREAAFNEWLRGVKEDTWDLCAQKEGELNPSSSGLPDDRLMDANPYRRST